MGSTSSETLPSSARRTDQESFHQKEPKMSRTSGNIEAFLFSCFKPRPRLLRDSDSDSDEVDRLTRLINDDMEFIYKVSETIKDYEDEIPELKREFNELLSRVKNTTSDEDHPVVSLANDLLDLHKKVTNLKEWMTAKDSEAEALKKMIRADQDFVKEVSEKTETYMNTRKSKEFPAPKFNFPVVEGRLDNLKEYGGTVVELRDLKRKVTKEKQRIMTSKRKDESKEKEEEEEEAEEEPESARYVTGTQTIKGGHAALEKMPNLSKSSSFAESSVFKEFEARYHELGMELKQCLLCFAVFPENAEIKKRVMTYWWMGEGFVPSLRNSHNSSNNTPEDHANDFFYELIAKAFIEPSSKLSSPGLASLIGVKICKMNPFVRSMVIMLAKKANFFDFDNDMNVTFDYSSSHRACLTGKRPDFNTRDLESLYTLFNVSESLIEFDPQWFRKMKYVKVLHLGRWQTSSKYHLDIVPTDIRYSNVLDGLGHVKHLRFLSLQRMSKMRSLPATILELENLTILDIRACQNLGKIPDGIGSLVNLTHLDMSECYFLDRMPKGLSKLIHLQVLGGFVVGESDDSDSSVNCTLADLKDMKNIRKLSINTGVENFPSLHQLSDLNNLESLRKLTISWGKIYSTKPHAAKDVAKDNKAPNQLAATDGARTASNCGLKEKPPCFPCLKAPKCLQDKRNASPKENSAPPSPPTAAEIGKDDNAPESAATEKAPTTSNFESKKELPDEKARKTNSVAESPATVEEQTGTTLEKKHVCFPWTKAVKRLRVDCVKTQSSPTKADQTSTSMHRQLKAEHLRDVAKLPSSLQKLDLQCFPDNKDTNQVWLKSENLQNLNKLYIRGGKCFDLGANSGANPMDSEVGDGEKGTSQTDPKEWKVELLRLKYLTDLKMEWKELQRLFPKLSYLETVGCPKLSFFPCNENGVWMKKL